MPVGVGLAGRRRTPAMACHRARSTSAYRSSRLPSGHEWRARSSGCQLHAVRRSARPAASNRSSKTQRMVNTVGPESMPCPADRSSRILPPGVGVPFQQASRAKPLAARSMAAAQPAHAGANDDDVFATGSAAGHRPGCRARSTRHAHLLGRACGQSRDGSHRSAVLRLEVVAPHQPRNDQAAFDGCERGAHATRGPRPNDMSTPVVARHRGSPLSKRSGSKYSALLPQPCVAVRGPRRNHDHRALFDVDIANAGLLGRYARDEGDRWVQSQRLAKHIARVS